MKILSCALSTLFATLLVTATGAEPLPSDTIRRLVDEHSRAAIDLYREFLSLPNDANFPVDIETQTLWMEDKFASLGFTTERIATVGSALLLAELRSNETRPTVLVYLQADGQPVAPGAWFQEDPYTPVLKAPASDGEFERIPWNMLDTRIDPDWRVFARSASDSKGPMTQFMMAIELFHEARFELPYNLKVIIDTEEELGSPNLPKAVEDNRERLSADMLLIFDGPPHASKSTDRQLWCTRHRHGNAADLRSPCSPAQRALRQFRAPIRACTLR